MRRRRSRAKTTSRKRSGGGRSTIRPSAASSVRSGSGWSIGRRSARSVPVANRSGSQKRRARRHGERDQRPLRRQTHAGAPKGKREFSAPKAAAPDVVTAPISTGVQTVTVSADEAAMRLARFFAARFPGLSFSHIQRIIRKGEVRVNGKRADPKDRIETGQQVRIPPLKLNQPKPAARLSAADEKTRAFLQPITLHDDED